jgi:hypothetical protein
MVSSVHWIEGWVISSVYWLEGWMISSVHWIEGWVISSVYWLEGWMISSVYWIEGWMISSINWIEGWMISSVYWIEGWMISSVYWIEGWVISSVYCLEGWVEGWVKSREVRTRWSWWSKWLLQGLESQSSSPSLFTTPTQRLRPIDLFSGGVSVADFSLCSVEGNSKMIVNGGSWIWKNELCNKMTGKVSVL